MGVSVHLVTMAGMIVIMIAVISRMIMPVCMYAFIMGMRMLVFMLVIMGMKMCMGMRMFRISVGVLMFM